MSNGNFNNKFGNGEHNFLTPLTLQCLNHIHYTGLYLSHVSM